jgi:hypothetical protein
MTVRQVVTRQRLRSAALPAACWVWTRGVLLMFTFKVIPYISQGDIVGDVKLYNKWSLIFAQGRFPRDPMWQYPPGAALLMALPRVLRSATGISYYSAFYLLALFCDLVIFLMVLYSCWRTADRRTAARTGASTQRVGPMVENGTARGPANGTGIGPGSATPIAPAARAKDLLDGDSGAADGASRAEPVRPDYTGLWAYTVAIFMIGPIVIGRYDIMVTMVATAGLVVAGRSAAATWRLRGAAIGFGAVLKLWPAAIMVGLPKRAAGRRALLWASVGAGVPALALTAVLPGAAGFLSGQQDRGLEIEAVPATVFLIARRFGYPARIRHQYGAFEITGPGIGYVSVFSLLLTLAGFVWLLAWWRRRADLVPGGWTTALYYDAGLVAVLIAIVTSRVLSPQYLVWLVGLIALCLTLAPDRSDGTASEAIGPDGRSVLAGPCWTLLAAISVTQIEFPLLFPRLIQGGHWSVWFLAGRNLMLVAATAWGVWALWRAAAPAPRPTGQDDASVYVKAETRSPVAQPEQQPAGP